MPAPTRADVWNALTTVNDPDLKKPLTELGMIDALVIEDSGHVSFEIKLTTTACPLKEVIRQDAENAVANVPGVTTVDAVISKNTITLQAATPQRAPIAGIRNIIAVSSGKGGVGKSTVATNLACAIAKQGARVGVLDADIYGPNVPLMMGLQDKKPTSATDSGKIIPLENHGVKVMSMAFLVKRDQPVVWRGPMLDKVIRQFLTDTVWGTEEEPLDYLLIDLPPGTGDAQLTIVQATPVTGAVIVTTPQDVALMDSRKGLAMFKNTNIPVFGIVENMSLYHCPNCHHEAPIFGHGGGQATAEELNLPLLAQVPLVPGIREKADAGFPIVVADPESPPAKALTDAAHQVVAQVCAMGVANVGTSDDTLPKELQPA